MLFFAPSSRFSYTGALAILAAASLQSSVVVDAHGYLTTPRAEFFNGVMATKYSATMTPCFSGKFDDSPQANVNTFTKAFEAQKETGFKTLRALLDTHGQDCGVSNPNASRKPIPENGKVVWQNPDTGEGFVASHTGPCEIWLDKERVFSDDNCAGHFTSNPAAALPVDFSACTGDCMLRFYWLALHEPTWQIYKNCVPLTGNGGSNLKSKSLKGSDEYNAPSETPAMAPSSESTPSSVANEYSEPQSSPSPSPVSDEYSEPQSSPSPSPVSDEYSEPQSSPSPSPSPVPDEYSEPQSSPKSTKRPKCGKIRPHVRK